MPTHVAQRLKFSVTDFSSKHDQIHRKLRIWSHLRKKSVMETAFFVQHVLTCLEVALGAIPQPLLFHNVDHRSLLSLRSTSSFSPVLQNFFKKNLYFDFMSETKEKKTK